MEAIMPERHDDHLDDPSSAREHADGLSTEDAWLLFVLSLALLLLLRTV